MHGARGGAEAALHVVQGAAPQPCVVQQCFEGAGPQSVLLCPTPAPPPGCRAPLGPAAGARARAAVCLRVGRLDSGLRRAGAPGALCVSVCAAPGQRGNARCRSTPTAWCPACRRASFALLCCALHCNDAALRAYLLAAAPTQNGLTTHTPRAARPLPRCSCRRRCGASRCAPACAPSPTPLPACAPTQSCCARRRSCGVTSPSTAWCARWWLVGPCVLRCGWGAALQPGRHAARRPHPRPGARAARGEFAWGSAQGAT